MKILLAIFILATATSAFAQDQATGPEATGGCGPAKVDYDVKTNDKEHPTAPPDAAKAHIYFLQDDSEYVPHPRPSNRFGIDGMWVGATHSDSYFFVSVDPGEHHLCVSWQGIVGAGGQRKEDAIHFTADAGADYYFSANDFLGGDPHADPRYRQPARVLLRQLDSDRAQLLMSHFALSISNPKK